MAEKINHASISYALGILSIIFAFFTPTAGLVIGIVGLIKSKKSGSKEAQRLNIIGLILSIVSLVISIYLLTTTAGASFPVA